MTASIDRPQLHESGTAARTLGVSLTRLHELERRLPAPVLRTTSGRRLFTDRDLEALQRLRRRAMVGDGGPTDAAA